MVIISRKIFVEFEYLGISNNKIDYYAQMVMSLGQGVLCGYMVFIRKHNTKLSKSLKNIIKILY